MKTISSSEFLKNYQPGSSMVIDVRTPEEYAYKHIPQSINIPAEELAARLGEIPRDQNLYIICQSGLRSTEGCRTLESLGLSQLTSIEGGLSAFEKAGGSVIQTSKTLPIMRQVQIAAGSLVVFGIAMARLAHPSFIYISLFVGCGLIFAGITGFCGMAILLSRMPWNKQQEKSCPKERK